MSKILCFLGLHQWLPYAGWSNDHTDRDNAGCWGVDEVCCGSCGKAKRV